MADDPKAPTPPAPTPAAPTPSAPTPAAAQAVPAGTTPTTNNAAEALEKAAEDQAKAAAPSADKPNPGPVVPGSAIPPHEPLPPAVQAERLRPDVAAGQARPIQHTQPIIGGVEGNIPMPVAASLVGAPFAQMGVGDSFEVGEVSVAELQAAADGFAAKAAAGVTFKAAQWKDGKARVWRLT